jgi:rhodanese-related sulfurtransferase
MYNPFPLLSKGLLNDQLLKGKRWFVRQTFPRGMEPRLIAAFLLRAYDEEEKDIAEKHLAALEKDRNAFLYDAQDPEHLAKLHIAASQPFGYKVFYAARKGIEWRPPQTYQEKMRRYIFRHHPAWRPLKAGDKIEIGLYEEFGQLFLKFSHDGENDTIPFDLIEKY